MVDRYGKLLALSFSTILGAKTLEEGFKKIDYNGNNPHIWSEITTKDNKSSAGAQISLVTITITITTAQTTPWRMCSHTSDGLKHA